MIVRSPEVKLGPAKHPCFSGRVGPNGTTRIFFIRSERSLESEEENRRIRVLGRTLLSLVVKPRGRRWHAKGGPDHGTNECVVRVLHYVAAKKKRGWEGADGRQTA